MERGREKGGIDMPIMQLRTSDDAYPLSRLDFGAIDTGTTSVQIGFRLWNDRPTQVSGELLGTADGARVSFATQFKPLVNHPEAPVAVKVDGSPATGVSVDHENGLIVFSTPPADGKVITCDYAYSVGSTDANAVIVTMEQVAGFAGDGVTRSFPLPSRCLTPLKLLVGGVEIPEGTGFEIRDDGESLYIMEPPEANESVLFSYVDPVCQGGYYETRSSGLDNPYDQSNMADDAEAAFFKLGGAFSVENRLVGTGDGSKKIFDTGTPLIRGVSKVLVGGQEVTDYALNNVKGTVTFGAAPAVDSEIRMDYSYERGHAIGNIRQWSGRRCFLRASLPYDAPNSVLTARFRVISQ
ncbi:hypothetical protein L2W58_00220 [Dethiosulfovibrio sp. F2B]|nr:hypothetical protein [Dethiosulfovibrio faecalis]MCF4150233.1 hypothetical protein [Dethiosulfovibrio faecalis]